MPKKERKDEPIERRLWRERERNSRRKRGERWRNDREGKIKSVQRSEEERETEGVGKGMSKRREQEEAAGD